MHWHRKVNPVTLIRDRQRKSADDFKDFFDPLFQELLLVHRDYVQSFDEFDAIMQAQPPIGKWAVLSAEKNMRLFHDCKNSSKISPAEREKAIRIIRNYSNARLQHLKRGREFLANKSREFEPVRLKIQAIARAGAQFKSREEAAFLRSVSNFFCHIRGIEPDTDFISTLRWLDEEIRSTLKLVESNEDELRYWWGAGKYSKPELRQRWSNVCEAYATLKIKAMRLR
jgi:hypothetical protein